MSSVACGSPGSRHRGRDPPGLPRAEPLCGECVRNPTPATIRTMIRKRGFRFRGSAGFNAWVPPPPPCSGTATEPSDPERKDSIHDANDSGRAGPPARRAGPGGQAGLLGRAPGRSQEPSPLDDRHRRSDRRGPLRGFRCRYRSRGTGHSALVRAGRPHGRLRDADARRDGRGQAQLGLLLRLRRPGPRPLGRLLDRLAVLVLLGRGARRRSHGGCQDPGGLGRRPSRSGHGH